MLFQQEGARAQNLAERARRRWTRGSLHDCDDERLSAFTCRGDDDAFELLYQRYSTPIYRYLRRRLSSDEEAEDVQQQVFLSAYSALRAGVRPVRFRSWLYRIAHNVCVSELRSRKPVAVQLDDERGLASLWADSAARDRENLRELLDDLGNLPRAQSSALLLRELNDLSYAEIAETLHLPVATVRSNIFRARSALQGMAHAREEDCEEIRAELARVAGRRGRRPARVTNHLRVCTDCEAYRRRLRERPGVLSLLPFLPVAWMRPLRALFGSSEATAGGLVAAGSGGAAAALKLAAVAASVVALSIGGEMAVNGGDSGRDATGDDSAVPDVNRGGAYGQPSQGAPGGATGGQRVPDGGRGAPADHTLADPPTVFLGPLPVASPPRPQAELVTPVSSEPVGDAPSGPAEPVAFAPGPSQPVAPAEQESSGKGGESPTSGTGHDDHHAITPVEGDTTGSSPTSGPSHEDRDDSNSGSSNGISPSSGPGSAEEQAEGETADQEGPEAVEEPESEADLEPTESETQADSVSEPEPEPEAEPSAAEDPAREPVSEPDPAPATP